MEWRLIELYPAAVYVLCITAPPASRNRARKRRFDYFLVGLTGVSEALPAAAARLGRRTALTFPLFPPPQKN